MFHTVISESGNSPERQHSRSIFTVIAVRRPSISWFSNEKIAQPSVRGRKIGYTPQHCPKYASNTVDGGLAAAECLFDLRREFFNPGHDSPLFAERRKGDGGREQVLWSNGGISGCPKSSRAQLFREVIGPEDGVEPAGINLLPTQVKEEEVAGASCRPSPSGGTKPIAPFLPQISDNTTCPGFANWCRCIFTCEPSVGESSTTPLP